MTKLDRFSKVKRKVWKRVIENIEFAERYRIFSNLIDLKRSKLL